MQKEDFIKKWNEECLREGGRWAKNDLEHFSKKRAMLFDSILTKKQNLVFTIIIILSLLLSYILVPYILFKGVSDYVVIVLIFFGLFIVSLYCWKQFNINEKVSDSINVNNFKGGNINV